MSWKLSFALVAVCGALAMPVAAQQQRNEAREFMERLGLRGLKGEALERAIEKAETHPLGSRDNPVRASMPVGQQAYLRRLRCPDGTPPAFERKGNIGSGVYVYYVDHYMVTCPGAAPVDIFMDMYHDHVEQRPVAGFTIEPAPGAD